MRKITKGDPMGATLTSFYFLCFLLAVLVVYYVCPGRFRWVILLLSSIAYYLLSGNGILLVYPLITCTIAFFGGKYIDTHKPAGKKALVVTILLILAPLFALKYINFLINTINFIPKVEIPNTKWLVPLGISFYTFTILGYVIDVYNGIAKRQENYFKLLTFGMYFPTMLSGPIMKYREDGEQFFTEHKLDYKNITFGAQRMLWGFFETLVISERMRMIADSVYNDVTAYQGAFIFFGTICYAVELYTNFSGCMDIVLGISEMLGLKLPENFDRPYFSKNISEYWRRWHITLGVWMKEYVFYPVLRTSFFNNLQSKLKAKYNKKTAKRLTTFLAMFILWFTVGVWHGGDWKYVIGSGLLHWFYIVMGELISPKVDNLLTKIHIDPKAKWVDILRCVRTFLLVCLGLVFFRASSVSDAVTLIKNTFTVWNIRYLFTGAIFCMGIDWVDFVVAVVSIGILIAVSALRSKGSIRDRIALKKLPIRWIIWFALLFYTILLGFYGPGFSAAEFIYQGF